MILHNRALETLRTARQGQPSNTLLFQEALAEESKLELHTHASLAESLAGTRPNKAVERTGHSVRFLAHERQYIVARRSPPALGVARALLDAGQSNSRKGIPKGNVWKRDNQV